MYEVSRNLLNSLLLLISLPLLLGFVARKFKLPEIIGYITAGLIVGNFLPENVNSPAFAQIAGAGIILLLFTIGLEVQLKILKKFGRLVIIGSIAQILFTTLAVFYLSLVFNIAFVQSLLLGAALSLSSTAIVAKLIQNKGEENSLHGNLAVGILIMQDLAVIPLIILFTTLGRADSLLGLINEITYSVVKAVIIFSFLYFIGKRLIPFILESFAHTSRELLNLLTLFIIVLTVFSFITLGLPASIAAFIAGMLIAQSKEHYHIFSQIRPLRDLFSTLFFVYLGSTLNFSIVYENFFTLLMFSLLLILVKFIVTSVVFVWQKLHSRTVSYISTYLAQGGEFAFILLHIALLQGLLSESIYMFAISVVLLTIALSPILIEKKNYIYSFISKSAKKFFPSIYFYIHNKLDREPARIEALNLKDHIIICGYGRIGKYVGMALRLAGISFIAVDRNIYAVEKAQKDGVNIIYGDPTNIDILDYLETEDAKALITAVPGEKSQESIIAGAKKLNPNIAIFTRVHNEEEQAVLHELGADKVVHPEFEASLTIVKEVLLHLGFSLDKISKKFNKLKSIHSKNLSSAKHHHAAESYS